VIPFGGIEGNLQKAIRKLAGGGKGFYPFYHSLLRIAERSSKREI
jgi:hypothetical protein